MYVTGSFLSVPASSGNSILETIMQFSGSLMKFGVHMSAYVDGDCWFLSSSDVSIFDNIYTKGVPESFVFEIGKFLNNGASLYFNFYNSTSAAKTVWVDYYFIR
jgi:hypothetical protein